MNWGSGPSVVLPVFEAFQAARLEFAMEISKLAVPELAPGDTKVAAGSFEVASTEKALSALEHSTTLTTDLLPLVRDMAPQVSESALLAVGRLGALSNCLHEKLVAEKVLTQAIELVSQSSSLPLVKAALFQLTVATKKTEATAQAP